MDSIPYDVVILPDPRLADIAIGASQKLQKFDSFFTLRDGECFPHVSLYMLQLKAKDLPKVEQILFNIAASTTLLQLQVYRYGYTMGFIDAEYEKFPELIGLQQATIKELNPIRDGMQQNDIERMHKAEGLALENFQTYGYKYVGDLFRPHMTLSRLKSDSSEALSTLNEVGNFSGTFTQLGLFEMGDDGTCVRKIKAFDLQS